VWKLDFDWSHNTIENCSIIVYDGTFNLIKLKALTKREKR